MTCGDPIRHAVKDFFSDPVRSGASISPDGTRIAYLAPEQGRLNVWIEQVDGIDGVDWAVKEGIAGLARVAIFGGSYGGYSALVGATFTPEVFASAIDYCGISSLANFMRTLPIQARSFLRSCSATGSCTSAIQPIRRRRRTCRPGRRSRGSTRSAVHCW
ncbi:prolyl oligopeptidase family serine peptidase [Sphaerisporangium sp. NPDC051011]|uniref:S9 family peptidase n=1 Tax=Sphaerisporangium sp. NPDC051011 TaxID=3155792 RepID=UPI0033CAB832